MEFLFTSILIGIGLAMDSFAVSLGVGTGQSLTTRRSKLRLALHFGVFQTLMTALGWLAGHTIVHIISAFDHWVAFGLLFFVGVRMIRAGFHPERETYRSDPSKGGLLVLLSLATSMDALAVGLSMAMMGSPVILPALVIGVVTFGMSLVGLFWGYQLGQRFGKRMEIVGGVILIAIGLRVLWTHLVG
jgi:putative Mn2+ efflux pump MntP